MLPAAAGEDKDAWTAGDVLHLVLHNDMAGSFLSYCASAKQHDARLHYKALVDELTANTFSKLDPATSSQFLLNCFRLLVGPRMPVVLGTAPAQEGGVSGVAVDTVSTVDTNDFKDGEADASNPVADTALPSHVWQQREQLSHLVLDLAEGPFARVAPEQQTQLQAQAHICLIHLLATTKQQNARMVVKLLQCFRMYEYAELRTNALLRYVQRLERNKQAMSSASLRTQVDLQQLLLRCAAAGQENAVAQWLTRLPSEEQSSFIQQCIDQGLLRMAVLAVRTLDVHKDFPDVEAQYMRYKLQRMVDKGLWGPAAQLVGDAVDMQCFLIRSMAAAGEISMANEYRHVWGLAHEDTLLTAEQLEADAAMRLQAYLQLPEPSQVQLRVVDNAHDLAAAAAMFLGSRVVGIDAEWKPATVSAAGPHPPSVLQIASGSAVMLLDLLALTASMQGQGGGENEGMDGVDHGVDHGVEHGVDDNQRMDNDGGDMVTTTAMVESDAQKENSQPTGETGNGTGVPGSSTHTAPSPHHVAQQLEACLHQVLAREDVTVVGFDVGEDLRKLAAAWPSVGALQHVPRLLDLKGCADVAGMDVPRKGNNVSLSKLCEHVLGKPLDKGVRMTDWEARPLTAAQVRYAALDAWSLVKIYDTLATSSEETRIKLQSRVQSYRTPPAARKPRGSLASTSTDAAGGDPNQHGSSVAQQAPCSFEHCGSCDDDALVQLRAVFAWVEDQELLEVAMEVLDGGGIMHHHINVIAQRLLVIS